ncbi:MAG: threonine/serine dehydratase [candidate division KSB1 bacterium]|nr:threonine/serine dehydratase [candidate division KSB1 bacterium]MDZ7272621.1 threonine/serine dehydratase [candidate division KSB1 bacterium]MDZ7284356.1 threonine/serine dehydratase [candidate division KSB1 bacterium]MDZ7297248.1 threonine/serine dehydratase [candidate division KSB1 bacterium]MDZ7348115.1 threonine/serine dehydratase [candidate division KSB1 bacterium]
MQKITLLDVFAARQVIAPYLAPTPLYPYPGLHHLLGTSTYVKHENHQPVGAFKIRGGIYFMSRLAEDEKRRGVVTASTGNHGQAIAYAGRLYGVPVTIVVPAAANPVKVEAIRSLGARLVFHGRNFEEARHFAEAHAHARGNRFISSGDEPWLIAGVATLTLEIIASLPEVGTIIVPVGGGSGAAGCCIVAKTINPQIRVIGVQAENAPAVYLSWKSRKRVEAKIETFAEGLATAAPFDLPLAIMLEHLDDFVLVSEGEMRQAVRLLIEHTRNLPEAAAAAPLAAALKIKATLAPRPLVLVMSGGNISLPQLQEILDHPTQAYMAT